MKATREDFEDFLKLTKNAIKDKNIGVHQLYNFKDYSEFIDELKIFLEKNSNDKWEIITTYGIGIQRV